MRNKILYKTYDDLCHLDCEINLNELFETHNEREKFNKKFHDFIKSDPGNILVYKNVDEIKKRKTSLLKYKSEHLIPQNPQKKDNRPPLLLVLGNPATHSVNSGMFFSFEGSEKEHRFWTILKSAGLLNLPFEPGQPVSDLNIQRRDALLSLDYESPFRIGLSVMLSMPSAPSEKIWSGVAGVQKLIGAKAFRRLERAETEWMIECARDFLTPNGAVVAFQKNAWNNLRSEDDPLYNFELAKTAKLQGTLKDTPEISIFCVPPTRLSGSCAKALKAFFPFGCIPGGKN